MLPLVNRIRLKLESLISHFPYRTASEHPNSVTGFVMQIHVLHILLGTIDDVQIFSFPFPSLADFLRGETSSSTVFKFSSQCSSSEAGLEDDSTMFSNCECPLFHVSLI